MAAPDLFSAAEQARTLRDAGIQQVESNNLSWVERARDIALQLAAKRGEVTADDVRAVFKEEPNHPNAWGAVFRSPRLKWGGTMRPSSTVSRHAGLQRVWLYVPNE